MSQRKRSFLIRDILADVNVSECQPRDDEKTTTTTNTTTTPCPSDFADLGTEHLFVLWTYTEGATLYTLNCSLVSYGVNSILR